MAKKEVIRLLPTLESLDRKARVRARDNTNLGVYKYGQQKKAEEAAAAIEKLPDYSDKYEEGLIKKLFEEELRNKKTNDSEESEYYEGENKEHTKKKNGTWDVPLNEPIRYFDPELSYEITGYRPIDMNNGFDFNPKDFTEAANTFETTGVYTNYPKDCKPYVDYWNEQKRRCVEGLTVGKYRITGDHYFFLNFYRMQTVNIGTKKATVGRSQNFPNFLAKQYEFFHYLEMCEVLGKDVIMLKARGLGFSEILACIGVRPFITTRGFHTIYTAFADAQLDPVLDKCWEQLNWLNMNTNSGMKRSRQKIDNVRHKRASLVTSTGEEFGFKSDIEGIVADNPRKIRGNRTERLIYEEAGSYDNLIKAWIQGNALVELGGIKIGTRIGGGE